jgi:hypothetical protein
MVLAQQLRPKKCLFKVGITCGAVLFFCHLDVALLLLLLL